MSITPSSSSDAVHPTEYVTSDLERLSTAWRELPPPARFLGWAVVVAITAPALRRAADSLSVEPLELVQLLLRD